MQLQFQVYLGASDMSWPVGTPAYTLPFTEYDDDDDHEPDTPGGGGAKEKAVRRRSSKGAWLPCIRLIMRLGFMDVLTTFCSMRPVPEEQVQVRAPGPRRAVSQLCRARNRCVLPSVGISLLIRNISRRMHLPRPLPQARPAKGLHRRHRGASPPNRGPRRHLAGCGGC